MTEQEIEQEVEWLTEEIKTFGLTPEREVHKFAYNICDYVARNMRVDVHIVAEYYWKKETDI